MTQKRVALVTGASRREGIGFELCRMLAKQDFDVVLTARSRDKAKQRAAELAAEGLSVYPYEVDVDLEASVLALRDWIASEFQRLDVLVNNAAGIAPFGELAATADLTSAHRAFETTVFGTWRMCQAFLPLLRKSAHPRIVNVSSGAGSHGDPVFGLTTNNGMGTSYAAAKAALNALTVKLANEERDHRVLINAVCPGFTATFDGGAAMGARPVQDGARSVLWGALLPDGGPTAGFFRDGMPLPW